MIVSRTNRIVVVCLFFGLTLICRDAARAQGDEAEHDALRQLKPIYEKAVNENQIDLLEPLLHPEFSGVMVTNDPVSNLKELKDYWKWIEGLIGENGHYKVTLNPERSLILGNVALARGTTDDVVVTGGKELKFESNWTAVLEKVGGSWKILRVQGSMNPVSNPFAKAAVEATFYSGGATGGVIGLLLGVAATLIIRRKRAS